jgi:hypothetical protein
MHLLLLTISAATFSHDAPSLIQCLFQTQNKFPKTERTIIKVFWKKVNDYISYMEI